jgi:hypothetical protein
LSGDRDPFGGAVAVPHDNDDGERDDEDSDEDD